MIYRVRAPRKSSHFDATNGEPGAPQRTDFRRRVHCLLGLPFDSVSMREALARIGAASISSPCFLSTPNLNFLIASQRDPAFRDSVIRSDLSVADGMPLLWIARLLGVPIRERVAGSDLFDALLRGKGRSFRAFFFGGPDGIAEAACGRLNAMSSSLRCVGFASPGSGTIEQMSAPEMIKQINDSGADFVVVALGAKKGQAWIEYNRGALCASVISHLGAVVNFVAGRLSRAPIFVQRLGLEWLWRIKEEPALWRRYLGDAMGLLRLTLMRVLPGMAYRALGFLANGRPPAKVLINADRGLTRLTLSGSWAEADLPVLRQTFESVTRERGDIDLDLADLSSVDEAFIGLLMLLYGHQSKMGCKFRVISVAPGVRRAFRLRCAEFLL